jgi:hypothetical protein
MPTEEVAYALCAELVVAEVARSLKQAESVRLDDRAPAAGLAADRAVALVGSLVEIDIGFVTHGAAVAAAPVGFQHRSVSA